MKINIAASHRFHLLDLARELERLGHDVRFYSYVPTKRCVSFGLSRKACKWMWWIVPTFGLDKILKSYLPNKIRLVLLDWSVALSMRKCDVFIALSGAYLQAIRSAQKQGAKIVLERGSKHILEQKKVLDSIPSLKGKQNIPEFNIKRDLIGYEMADYISIASRHVKESFLQHGFPLDKIFVNPYGVDLSMFYPIFDIEKKYDVIMVGGWSYRKGCDLIIKAIEQLKVNFLHVGSIVDIPFPKNPYFTHVDAVDQRLLVNFYNQAKIFVLPSREEGLAMVQMQAVSCNLPLICSNDTGGSDLKQYVGDTKAISVIETHTVECLVKHITEMLRFIETQPENIIYYDMDGKEQLTWSAYGKRYSDFLKKIIRE